MADRRTKALNIKPVSYDIYCSACGKSKTSRSFYSSKQVEHDNDIYHKKYPICKACIKEKIYRKNTGQLDKDEFKKMLQKLNLPFKNSIFLKALEDTRESFGTYISLLNTAFRYDVGKMTWIDGDAEESETKTGSTVISANNVNTNVPSGVYDAIDNIDELMDKWGYGYTNEEYRLFEHKWSKLIDNYGEKTSLHVEALTTYIRFRSKEQLATAKGDIKEAKEWASMAATAQKDGKLNVSQLSKSDISGGIDLLPQLFEAVESNVGIISILPTLKEQPYDDADIIIWCVVNYMRRLEDKPRIEYREIWDFYDEMLEEHFKQQGLSKEAIVKEKEKRNNIFRDLSKVYKEPIYEESDT